MHLHATLERALRFNVHNLPSCRSIQAIEVAFGHISRMPLSSAFEVYDRLARILLVHQRDITSFAERLIGRSSVKLVWPKGWNTPAEACYRRLMARWWDAHVPHVAALPQHVPVPSAASAPAGANWWHKAVRSHAFTAKLVRGTSFAVAKDVLCQLGVPLTAHLKRVLRPAAQGVEQPKAAEQPKWLALHTLIALQLGPQKSAQPTLSVPRLMHATDRVLSPSEAAELFAPVTEGDCRPAYRVAMAERKVRRPLAEEGIRTTIYGARRDRSKPPGRDIADPMHPKNRAKVDATPSHAGTPPAGEKPPTSSRRNTPPMRRANPMRQGNNAAGAHRF